MAPRVGIERLAQAAFWYYVQDLGQDEVARRLGTSRSNVSRLLRAAREQGVVRFEIAYPLNRNRAWSSGCSTPSRRPTFERSSWPATPSTRTARPPRSRCLHRRQGRGRVAAGQPEGRQHPGPVLGRHDQDAGRCGPVRPQDRRARRAAGRRVEQQPALRRPRPGPRPGPKLGGRHTYFNAPAVAASAAEAAALAGGSQVGNALALARSADVAIVGIGSFPTGTTEQFLTTPGRPTPRSTRRPARASSGRSSGASSTPPVSRSSCSCTAAWSPSISLTCAGYPPWWRSAAAPRSATRCSVRCVAGWCRC